MKTVSVDNVISSAIFALMSLRITNKFRYKKHSFFNCDIKFLQWTFAD